MRSKREWINYYILQWLFIRSCRTVVKKEVEIFGVTGWDQFGASHPGARFFITQEFEKVGFMFGAIPGTGWDAIGWKYIWGCPRFIWGKAKPYATAKSVAYPIHTVHDDLAYSRQCLDDFKKMIWKDLKIDRFLGWIENKLTRRGNR